MAGTGSGVEETVLEVGGVGNGKGVGSGVLGACECGEEGGVLYIGDLSVKCGVVMDGVGGEEG